jgi:hypothetical protein
MRWGEESKLHNGCGICQQSCGAVVKTLANSRVTEPYPNEHNGGGERREGRDGGEEARTCEDDERGGGRCDGGRRRSYGAASIANPRE